jgi:subtilase family serine protease
MKFGKCLVALSILSSLVLMTAIVPFARATVVPVTQPVYESCPTSSPYTSTTPSHFLVFFTLQNQGELTTFLDHAYYTPSNPSYHKFISASQFDTEYSAPASVFTLVESIFSSNGLTTLATAPMFIEGSGTLTQVNSALAVLSSEPAGIQEHIIGAECMPQTIDLQSSPNVRIPHYTPAHHQGGYVGTAPSFLPSFSPSTVCTYNEVVSGAQVWFPCGLQTIYDENPLLNHGYSGSHQTIALVDAYGDPETAAASSYIYNNIACSDFALFDIKFSLPYSSCSVIYPTGVPVLTTNNVADAEDWSIETAIDMQYSHTMAPQAHIMEVTASTDYDDLYASIEYVLSHQSANMISLSWGEWEDLFYYPTAAIGGAALMLGYDEVFEQAAAQGIGVFVSSGDYAAYDPQFSPQEVSASAPATDPWVAAVGGTTLTATFTPSSVSRLEHAWSLGSDSYNTIIGTGGGFSMLFEETPGQQLVHISTEGVTSIPEPDLGLTFYPQGMRGEPDLSADADPSSGVLVVQDGAFSSYFWGGTSLAAPLTAGMTATVQSSTGSFTIGDLAPSLYLLYQQENGAFYVHQTHFTLSQLNQGVQGVMFVTAYGQNGPFYVIPGMWNPVCGLGQLNVYGLSQVL